MNLADTSCSISVIILSDYRLDDRGSILGRGKEFFPYPLCPDQLWGPPSLLPNMYQWVLPRGKRRPGRDGDRSLHLVQRSRISRSYISSPSCRLHSGIGAALLYFMGLKIHHKEPG
jgi:hypothetical protein